MSGARKSAKYLFVGGLISKAVSFFGSILLARILFPEDFGYLLIAMIITSFIQVFGNMGFETFYLQEKIKSKEEEIKILNITFKLRLIVNMILFLLQMAISYIAADYYNNPIIGEMIRVFALSIPLAAFSQINLYILRKNLNYMPEVYANVSRDIFATLFKVIFALIGFGAMSFAIGAVIGNVVRFFILIRFQKFIPEWYLWDDEIFKRVFYFGRHSFYAGIGMFFTQQIDKILLTGNYPEPVSGSYYFANSQAQSIFSYIIAPQSSLVLSYSAKYKGNPDKLFTILSKIGYLIGIFMIPIIIYLVFYAEPIFLFVFGEKWANSIGMFQIFAIYYLLTELTFPFSALLTAYGLPQIASKLVIIRFIFLLAGLGVATYYNANIYVYILTYVGISFIFSWLKAYLGLIQMNKTLKEYIFFLKELILIGILYVLIIYVVDSNIGNISKSLIVSFFILAISSCFIHLFVYKNKFIDSIEIVFGREHKFIKRLKNI